MSSVKEKKTPLKSDSRKCSGFNDQLNADDSNTDISSLTLSTELTVPSSSVLGRQT